jgi:hypothetical protein
MVSHKISRTAMRKKEQEKTLKQTSIVKTQQRQQSKKQ